MCTLNCAKGKLKRKTFKVFKLGMQLIAGVFYGLSKTVSAKNSCYATYTILTISENPAQLRI